MKASITFRTLARAFVPAVLLAGQGVGIAQVGDSTPLTPQQALNLIARPASNAREFRGRHGRQVAIATLKASQDVGAEQLATVACTAIQDRRIPVRNEIVALACERADSESGETIIQCMRGFGDEFLGDSSTQIGAPFVNVRLVDSLLFRQFVTSNASQLSQNLASPRPVMDLLYDWLMAVQANQRDPRFAYTLATSISQQPVAEALRKEFVERVLCNYTNWPMAPSELYEHVDATMEDALLQTMSAKADTPASFPWGAARYFVERGDLRGLPALNQVEGLLYATAIPSCQAPDQFPDTLSWRLKLQETPLSILPWIAFNGQLNGRIGLDPNTRIWLIGKALSRGVAVDQVRQSVLDLYGSCNLGNVAEMSDMREIKQSCLRLGVITEEDMPAIVTAVPGSQPAQNGSPSGAVAGEGEPSSAHAFADWQPTRENYDVLVSWMSSIDWASMSEQAAYQLLRDKQCELNLIRPDRCAP